MDWGQISILVALCAFSAINIFRSPIKQVDDLRAEQERQRTEMTRLQSDVVNLSIRLAGEHYTRAEIREMHRDLRDSIEKVQSVVERAVDMQRNGKTS